VEVGGGWRAADWRGQAMGDGDNVRITADVRTGFREEQGTFTVSGNGNIAPALGGKLGVYLDRSLSGTFAGLIVAIVLAALFMTSEYRRELIRTTLTASTRRGQVLAAKAIVIGGATFVSALVGAVAATAVGRRLTSSSGEFVYPVNTSTEIRVIVGTAALLAIAAVLALAVGTVLRRSAGAVGAVLVLIVLPYILGVSSVLPDGPSLWLLRVTPAAAFAIQQRIPQYPQVDSYCPPAQGCFPLSPFAGLGVLVAYGTIALALAFVLLRRRDA